MKPRELEPCHADGVGPCKARCCPLKHSKTVLPCPSEHAVLPAAVVIDPESAKLRVELEQLLAKGGGPPWTSLRPGRAVTIAAQILDAYEIRRRA